MSTGDDAKTRFEQDMWESYLIPKRKHHYDAQRFREMIEDYGAIGAAETLVATDEIHPGLIKLHEFEMLALSVEALILKPAYHGLFTPQLRERARQKLKNHFNYQATWDTGN